MLIVLIWAIHPYDSSGGVGVGDGACLIVILFGGSSKADWTKAL